MSQNSRDELFADLGEPIDWAESVARDIACRTFDAMDISFTLKRFAEEILGIKAFESVGAKSKLAFSISLAIAPELRKFRSDALGDHSQSGRELADKKMEIIRKQIMSPDSTARQLRKYAESLDGKGWSDEANVLRDAAVILEEDM